MTPFILYSIVFIVSLCALLITLYIIRNLYGQITGEPPFINTRKRAFQTITAALQMKDGDTLYDIGCGKGALLAHTISHTKNTHGVGIEINPFAFLLAKIKTRNLPIKIVREDFFHTSLSNATHIYCYLLPSFVKKIEQKIVAECAPGTRIVVCDFGFETLSPIETISLKEHGALTKKLYVYQL